MIEQTRYSISELADQAQVSARTVRYYTEIGLLPEPALEGKYTVYNEDHLNRLKLIAHLKNSYLPLKEIRQYLASKSEQEIALEVNNTRVLKEDNASLFFSGVSEVRELSSAKDYLSSILSPSANEPGDDKVQELYSTQANQPAPRPQGDPRSIGTKFGSRLEERSELNVERWERHTLAEGVELSVRHPADPQVRADVETLIGLARKLFRGKPGRIK